MGKGLKKCVIAATGDFGTDKSDRNIRSWVEYHGGTFTSNITSEVTHLVCSHDHYKRNVQMVKEASKHKSIRTVTFDWLEDSLLNKGPKRVNSYLLSKHVKRRQALKAAKQSKRKQTLLSGIEKFKKDCGDFQKHMRDGYEIYRDPSGFAYDITLARVDLTTNTNERYHLKLFQTHDVPKHYACFTTYSSPKGISSSQMLAPMVSSFEEAMSQFEHFFKLKTRVEWSDRFEKAPEEDQVGADGRVLPKPFRYATLGRCHDPSRPDAEW